MIDISFIIPVYNGSSTILRCLDSVLSIGLSPDRFEIIVIDDCSTDETYDLLYSQKQRYNNLLLVQLNVNSKPGAARNRGLKHARGKYVFFLDSDDTLEIGFVGALEYALRADVDMLLCRIQEQSGTNGTFMSREYKIPDHITFDGKDFCEEYYSTSIAGALSHYLYRRSYLNSIAHKFVEGVIYEDLDWVEFHLFNCRRIEYHPSLIYSYFANQNSILHTDSISNDVDKLLFCFRRLSFAYSQRQTNPRFYSVVSICTDWVYQILSFRHLTRHSRQSLNVIFKAICPEVLPFFRELNWAGFTKVCIYHPSIIFFVSTLAHPFALYLRGVKQLLLSKC